MAHARETLTRRSGGAYRWLNRHPFLTCLIIVVLVAGPGYLRLESIARCGQDYVQKSNSASTPVRAASASLDAADDRVWQAVNAVLTQQADKADYDELRSAVAARAQLSDELAQARERHPFPDPPSTFC